MFGVAPVPSHEVQNFRLTPYQEFIHKTRYSRWIAGRRESWRETVSRYIEFMVSDVVIRVDENRRDEVTTFLRSTVFDYIYTMKSMPSMRCMMTAGEALRRDNIAAYNCSYIAVSSPSDFSEALYILLNGTGVGFSCEREFVEQLPIVPSLQKSGYTIVVGDSKEGWAQAYKELVDGLYDGKIHTWDTSLVRPAGQRLKTFGGRSSGPEPLENLFNFTINAFLRAQGRRLEPIEVHDLMCMIGEIVVVGGVRRSALISLSDLDDKEMRHAKSGEWWKTTPWRGLANNSVAYKTTPAREVFDHEWQALVDSKSGERGIFNRESSQVQAAKYGRRPISISYGCNPCCISGDAIVDVMVAGEPQKMRFKDAVALVVGDEELLIKSYDSAGVVWQPITSAALMRKKAEVIKVTDVKTGKYVVCTPDHLIFTSNRGWVEAAKLLPDDELVVE